MVIETPLPDPASNSGHLSAIAGEEAVNCSNYTANRILSAERKNNVIVVGHDDIAVKFDGGAVAQRDIEVYRVSYIRATICRKRGTGFQPVKTGFMGKMPMPLPVTIIYESL